MKIPKKIKIGGLIYKIELVKPNELGKDCGECDQSRLLIRINRDMPQESIERSLFHEIFHAISGGTSEEIIDLISNGVYQVYKDNFNKK